MDGRLRFIEHRGCRILLQDFSYVQDEQEFMSLIGEAQQWVHRQPPESARILIDLTGSLATPAVSRFSREVTSSNTPFVRATALVGVSGLKPIIVRAISAAAGRELTPFASREQALEWLAEQG